MANLVRPWIYRYLDSDGRRVPSGTPGARRVRERARKWYAQGVPGSPPKKRIPLCGDKTAAQQLLAKLVRAAERGEAQLEDASTEAKKVKLSQHLADFADSLRDAGRTGEARVKKVVARCKRVFDGCGFVYPNEINVDRAV